MECPTCNGAKHCPECKGKGECTGCGGNGCERCAQTGECPTCGGWGYCPECEGTGEVNESGSDLALLENSPVETSGILEDGSTWAIEVVRTGVDFHGEVPLESWAAFTNSLVTFDTWAKWAIADCLNFGEAKYGDKYVQAVEITGLKYNTIAQWCWTANQVPKEIRKPDLDMEYHKKVAPKRIPEEAKEEYLKRAEAGEFSSANNMAEVIEQELFPDRAPPVIETCGCPICGANGDEGWKLTALSKVECSHCHAKGRELVDRVESYAALLEAFDAQARELAELRALLDAHPKKETVNE